MKERYGIEYKIYDYSGGQKRKVLDYRPSPGNIKTGVKLMSDKLGLDMMHDWKASIDKHIKKSLEVRK